MRSRTDFEHAAIETKACGVDGYVLACGPRALRSLVPHVVEGDGAPGDAGTLSWDDELQDELSLRVISSSCVQLELTLFTPFWRSCSWRMFGDHVDKTQPCRRASVRCVLNGDLRQNLSTLGMVDGSTAQRSVTSSVRL